MRASRKNTKPSLMRRVLACLVSAAMVVAFTPVVAWGAEGDVTYLYCDENGANWSTGTKHTGEYTVVTDTYLESTDYKLTGGQDGSWYVVKGTPINLPNKVVKIEGDVHLILADGCHLNLNGENGAIRLEDNDNNPNTSSTNSLTIYAQSTAQSTMGKLTATGTGISGSSGKNGGTITINGGIVEARDNGTNAAIGGGVGGSGGTVTINGGVVTAIANGSYDGGAAIGGGQCGSGGTVTINGGSVTAVCMSGGAAIGGGGVPSGNYTAGNGSTVTINGGTVIATGQSKVGIGGGYGASDNGTFSTGSDGKAVVFAKSIEDQSNKGNWSGVIFEGSNDGKIYGSPTLYSDLTIPDGTGTTASYAKKLTVPLDSTLTIAEGKTLTVPSDSALTNNGTIINKGTIMNSGTLDNTTGSIYMDAGTVGANGAVYYPLTLDADGGTINSGDIKYYNSNADTALPADVTKSGFTFAGWYDGNTKVEKIAQGSTVPITLTAKWNSNYVPPSDPSYNLSATVKGGVAVKVTVSGSTAVVAEISASALESAAGSGAATVTIDLSGLPKGVTQAQLSKSTLDKLLAVVGDAGNAVESVTVNLGGAVLTLDAKALAAVAGQVKGSNVTLGVKEGTADSLNSAQRHALSPFEVVQLYFTAEIKSGGVEIHDFGGGSVRVSVAFEPKPSHNPARYVVLYVAEDGAIERYATAWAAGMLSFTAPHFSTYAVVYVEDATQAAIDALEALPDAGKLKTSQAKEAVKRAEAALVQMAALDDGQRMLVDEALIANAESVVKRGNELVAAADKKAVGKVKDKAFSVKAGKSMSIAFKTKASAAGTKVVYKKTKGSKYISVTKSGKVIAKKGMKKGKTYTAKVKVTCGKAYKTVTITVKAK